MSKRVFIPVIIGILIASSVFFAFNYLSVSRELRNIKLTQTKIELNAKVINFVSIFIKKVLQADTEVDFETRLSLENAVRDLKDEEIITEWQNFIGSGTEAEAQDNVKKLLEILITKIQK